MSGQYHEPVLLQESVDYLCTTGGSVYVDATVGGGGHAAEICKRLPAHGRLICFDADDDAIAFSKRRLEAFGSQVVFIRENFNRLKRGLESLEINAVSGVLFDLGVSSFQLDAETRGFSHRAGARIDMRMDRRLPHSGWNVINEYAEERLAEILNRFGEEPASRRLARRIVNARPVETTDALAAIVREAVHALHVTRTLARVFQAVRIEVNDELQILTRVLPDAVEVLDAGGRLVVISYHSLEDRLVKDFLRSASATHKKSPVRIAPDILLKPDLHLLTKKPIIPGETEIKRNPRARSAKLRAAEKLVHG